MNDSRPLSEVTSATVHRPLPIRGQFPFIIATLVYAAAFYQAYLIYLNPTWEYFGFKLEAIDGERLSTGLVLLLLSAVCQPTNITRPAPLSLFIIYFNVYIPCLITSLLISNNAIQLYGGILLALTLVFCMAGLSLSKNDSTNAEAEKIPRNLPLLIWGLWLVSTLVLLVNFHQVMTIRPLADIEDIYEQRVAGTATGAFLGYTQTFYSSIFAPGLLAIGLIQRNPLAITAAFASGLLMYSITAQRTILFLPVIIVLMHWVISNRRTRQHATSVTLLILAALISISTMFAEESLIAAAVALLLTFRTIGIPGLTVSQYEDLFSVIGRTHWSHVKGIDLLVAPPNYATVDSLWPNLGYMVGDRTYNNPIFNVNANLFAGDGVAAAGALGVFIIGLIFTIWLKVVEKASLNWPRKFSALAIMPAAISMTNGHFFTTMLSFGGIFWLLVMFGMKPQNSRGAT